MGIATGSLIEGEEFFAPASSDLFDNLIAQYQRERDLLERAAEFVNGSEVGSVMGHFLNGNTDRQRGYTMDASRLFKREGAIASLNAHYWQKALSITDVMDYIPH